MQEEKEAFTLLQTVQENFEGFTQRQVKQAKLARRAQAMVGHPTDDKFKQMVSSKSSTNCHVKVSDVTDSITILGPYLPGLGGKRLDRNQRASTLSILVYQGNFMSYIGLLL